MNDLTGFLFLLLILVFYVYTYWTSVKRNRIPHFRSLAGLVALEEMVGRATEMGRPVFHSTGLGTLYSSGVGTVLASFVVFSEVANKCAQMNTELIVGIGAAEHIPIITALAEQAYAVAGVPENLNYNDLVFLGGTQSALVAAIMEIMDSRAPSSFLVTGSYGADIATYGGLAREYGTLSLCGTTNTYQYPYAVAAYDYWLIGEDFLAAAAVISKDPVQISNIWAGDLFRFTLCIIMAIGVILSWVGYNITQYLTM